MIKKQMAKAGRPKWSFKIEADIVQKITSILKVDWTIEEACAYAGISKTTHYSYLEKWVYFMNEVIKIWKDWNPKKEYVEKLYEEVIEEAKQYPFIIARKTLFNSINKGNDRKALEFLERRDKRYKPKQENDHKGIPVQPWVVILPSNNRDTAWQTQNKKQKK